MQAMTTHYWLSDAEGRLLETDETLGDLLGYSRQQLHDLTATDLETELVLQPTLAVQQRQAYLSTKRWLEASGELLHPLYVG